MARSDDIVLDNISSVANGKVATRNHQEESKEEDFEYVIVPPDGGWGWFIVAASFMGLFFSDGIVYSFGLIQRELELVFHERSEKVAWIFSIQTGVSLLSGKADQQLLYLIINSK